MQKFGSDEKEEALVDYRLHLYEKAYLIIDDVKIFEGTKHIEDKIRIIFVVHLEWEEPIIAQF